MVAVGRTRAVVAVGKVGGLFGSDGGLSLTLFDDFPTELNIEEPVFVKIDEHAVPLFFEQFRRRGQRGATVRFADIDTEARALELVGMEIFLPADGESAEDFENFVGWVADFDGGSTGEIVGFADGPNPLFEIGIAGGENILIPAALATEVDENGRKIFFELPEGLVELNLG